MSADVMCVCCDKFS